jgi:hypothetical protein
VTFVFKDAQAVKAQISHFLTSHPEIAEDVEFLADVLEGETDFNKVIEKAVSERQEAQSMSEAIKGRIDALSERKARYDRQAEAMKDLCRELMLSAGLDKLTLTEATLSITKPRTSVDVVSIQDLPQGFYRVERRADKKAIMEAFEAGFSVPGAALVKGEFGLTVRVK